MTDTIDTAQRKERMVETPELLPGYFARIGRGKSKLGPCRRTSSVPERRPVGVVPRKLLENTTKIVVFSIDALRRRRLSWQVWIRRGYAGQLLTRLSTFISAGRRECGDVAFFAAFSLFFHS